MGIWDALRAEAFRLDALHERELAAAAEKLADEQLGHETTRGELEEARLRIIEQSGQLTLVTEERDALKQRVAFCEANHGGPDPGPELPLVRPLAAAAVHGGYGVCQHVNFQSTVYKHQAEVLERYGAMHIGQMRSIYVPNLSGFGVALAAARQHDVKWHALVAKMDATETQVRNRIRHIAANAADVVVAIEGVNEPNGDGFTAAQAVKAATIQWWIWDEVSRYPELAHVVVYSCSMHDVNLDNSDGRHWQMFANATVLDETTAIIGRGRDFCHGGAVHGYQGGNPPGLDPKLDQRLAWCRDALAGGRNLRGDLVKVTEMGWTNAVNKPREGGHKVTSERASAAYDVQALFVYAWLGVPFLRYEFLDDPGNENVTESEFGFFEVTSIDGDPDSTWTPKAVVAPLTEALAWLEDPGEIYTPTEVGLLVEGDVHWCAVQKRDGSTRVYAWTPAPIWDPGAEVDLEEQLAEVTVTDAGGAHEPITVGARPVAIDVRT